MEELTASDIEVLDTLVPVPEVEPIQPSRPPKRKHKRLRYIRKRSEASISDVLQPKNLARLYALNKRP